MRGNSPGCQEKVNREHVDFLMPQNSHKQHPVTCPCISRLLSQLLMTDLTIFFMKNFSKNETYTPPRFQKHNAWMGAPPELLRQGCLLFSFGRRWGLSPTRITSGWVENSPFPAPSHAFHHLLWALIRGCRRKHMTIDVNCAWAVRVVLVGWSIRSDRRQRL